MASDEHHKTCFRNLNDPVLLAAIEEAARRVPKALKDRPTWPWIGRHFGRSRLFNGARVLILGHSHYEWCEACKPGRPPEEQKRLTCYCVAERAIAHENAYDRHWPNIENSFIGKAANGEERQRFWNSVAYANYVLRILREPKANPTADMWNEAEKAFFPLLDHVAPDRLFVLGEAVWSHLPKEDRALGPVCKNDRQIERCLYLRGNRKVIAYRLRHPRAGLGDPWHSAIEAVLRQADTQ